MRTPADSANCTETVGNGGVGSAAKRVADHAKAIVGLEVELASLELKKKVGALGAGIGMLLGAAVMGLFALGFLLATLAAGLDAFLPRWLSLLLVAVFLLVVAAVLGLLGKGRVQKGTPPVPQQAIREAKLTTEAIKSNGS